MKKSEYIARVKLKFATKFSIVNLRSISFYLGFKVERDWEKEIINFF